MRYHVNKATDKGPVVQSVVSLTKSLVKGLLSLTVLTKSASIIFFAEKLGVTFALHYKSYSHFFAKKWQCYYVCYV